jgi:ribonuclease D
MTPFGKLVETDEALLQVVDRLSRSKTIAIDTEFHGEKRYWPELLLIQIADDQEDPIAVDPLAVSNLAPLRGIMEDESITKVFHSARNDVSILRREIDCEIRQVFDTQIAAAFVGYGEQISLAKLVEKLCGNNTQSSFSLSDWSLRPLSSEQLDYALGDVRFLLEMHGKLSTRLEEMERTEWFQVEVERISDPATYSQSIVPVFRKARSSGKTKRRSLPLLWALVKWREENARKLNKPRQNIIRDGQLCRIAAMAPSSEKTLKRLRGLSSSFTGRWGSEVLRVVKGCIENPPSDVPVLSDYRNESGASARRDILRIYLKQKSNSMQIASSLLMPGDAFRSILSDPPRTLGSLMARSELPEWSKNALGEEFIALLSGKLALVLDKDPSRGISFVKTD